jgi:hypothetical protein
MSNRITRITRRGMLKRMLCCLAAVAVLTGGIPVRADLTVPVITYGTWQLIVKADDAAKAAGRHDFEEYVLIEYDGITAHEMSRLGFGTIEPATGLDALGLITFTVNISSRHHGNCKWSGTMAATSMWGTLVWTKDGKTYNYTFKGAPYTPVEAES